MSQVLPALRWWPLNEFHRLFLDSWSGLSVASKQSLDAVSSVQRLRVDEVVWWWWCVRAVLNWCSQMVFMLFQHMRYEESDKERNWYILSQLPVLVWLKRRFLTCSTSDLRSSARNLLRSPRQRLAVLARKAALAAPWQVLQLLLWPQVKTSLRTTNEDQSGHWYFKESLFRMAAVCVV